MPENIKNTFVHLDEEDQSVVRHLRRVKTEPALWRSRHHVRMVAGDSSDNESAYDSDDAGPSFGRIHSDPGLQREKNGCEIEFPNTDDECLFTYHGGIESMPRRGAPKPDGMFFTRASTNVPPTGTLPGAQQGRADRESELSESDDEGFAFGRVKSEGLSSQTTRSSAQCPDESDSDDEGVAFGPRWTDPLPNRPPQGAQAKHPIAPQGRQLSAPMGMMLLPHAPVTQVHAISVPAGLPPGSTILISQLPGNGGIVQVGAIQGCGAVPTSTPSPSPSTPGKVAPVATTAAGSTSQPLRGSPRPDDNRVDAGCSEAHDTDFALARGPGVVATAMGVDGALKVRWTVDARKLRGSDRVVVSSSFEAAPVSPGSFRLMLCPSSSTLKGGATFKNSQGRGRVLLKCESNVQKVLQVAMSISGAGVGVAPVQHDFTQAGVCSLGGDCNFSLAVDDTTKTFDVFVEIR